jgi:hypothetical protein
MPITLLVHAPGPGKTSRWIQGVRELHTTDELEWVASIEYLPCVEQSMALTSHARCLICTCVDHPSSWAFRVAQTDQHSLYLPELCTRNKWYKAQFVGIVSCLSRPTFFVHAGAVHQNEMFNTPVRGLCDMPKHANILCTCQSCALG